MSSTQDEGVRTLARAGTAERLEALTPATRELHRMVLHSFMENGEPPDHDQLRAMAAKLHIEMTNALARLAEADLVHTDDSGRVLVAYPFSGRPLGHAVHLDGVTVEAMCAIDALGIPLMTGRDAVITATDAATDAPIRVQYDDDRWAWEPASTVVLAAATRTGGPSVECCCPLVRFYAHAADARAELDNHPELRGDVLGQADAVEVARRCFGDLLGR